MRTQITLLVAAILSFALGQAFGADPPAKPEHPAVVALSQDGAGNWRYRHFPSLMPLYVSDADPPGKSTCDLSCSGPWPPLSAAADATPMGDWTVITRADGRRQWTYKNRPVYLRFHDYIEDPLGDGEDDVWHLIKP